MDHQANKAVISLRTDDLIRDEAANWLVRLENSLGKEKQAAKDQAELRKWLAEDPRHGQILKRQAAIWDDMDIFARAAFNTEHEVKISFWSGLYRSATARAWAYACSVFIVAAVWLFVPLEQASDEQFLSTNVGSQRIELLSEGSSAHLNTDSLIEVNFNENERAITLLRGEAMFDVAHNPDRPFVVYAEGSAVKAVGTRFVVRLTSDRIRVTVAEGQVQLSSHPAYIDELTSPAQELLADPQNIAVQEVILLSQGQEAEIDFHKPHAPVLNEVDEDEFQRKLSWLGGRLVFLDETLEFIITEISRYTPVRVVVTDPELKELRLSGRFQVGDTEALLEAIEVSGRSIQISRNADSNMIYISKAPADFEVIDKKI